MNERVQHRERWAGALSDSVVPVGLVNGSVDPVSGAHMIDRYREVIGRDDFIVEWPDIGHFPQVEAPKRFAEACFRFFERVAQEAGGCQAQQRWLAGFRRGRASYDETGRPPAATGP